MNCTKSLYTIFIKIISIILLSSIFSSCAREPILSKQSYLLFIKSKNLKFNDAVFIRNTKNTLTLDALSLGKSIASIKISNKNNICLNYLCYSGDTFNKKYFSNKYPKYFLSYILKGKPLFHKKHLQKMKYGFIQKIKNITYKRYKNKILFKDKEQNIIIKLTKI
jgi:hypothetical protein